MSEAITKRYEFVYLFDVENGNPNGDPDAGNMPRIDAETSHGIVTDVCLKRKVRNCVDIIQANEKGYQIYVRARGILTNEQKKSYIALEEEGIEKPTIAQARTWMCKNFFDVRTFGAVMSLKEFNCGQVRGPVQFNFARSIDPVTPVELSITRMAVATQKEADAQKGDNRTIGKKNIIHYGLYRAEGYISAHLAEQTGFTDKDLKLLWDALINMWDHDHSAARGKMNARKLIIFEHDGKLGNAPAHKLFDLVDVKRKELNGSPTRAFNDYEVMIDRDNVPSGVSLQELL
ncbi:MAG: type I-C CRISPR-associated protein Cas7/Csd2 [Desulfobacteraceae bacterium]|nr:type I-C CRISPR-associated protein Cas7/Csd2 [Desulfobacteraceae bacterium]